MSYIGTLPLDPQSHKLNRLLEPGRVMGVSPDARRSLTVVPLIGDKRYYGEAPVRLRRYERAVGDAVPPITLKTA